MVNQVETRFLHDLSRSGLTPEDLKAYPLDSDAVKACKLSVDDGYVIPYFNIEGIYTNYFRVRMFTDGAKYRQKCGAANHIYYPLMFKSVFDALPEKYIIITEGEKKAAKACKAGFPTIAFSGVDSWRSKVLQLPDTVELTGSKNGYIQAKLPGDAVKQVGLSLGPYAVGFEDLCNLIHELNVTIFICYDRDTDDTATGLKHQVQRAAADLGFEFRSRSIPINRIRQLCFPVDPDMVKVGIDDYLTAYSAESFAKLIAENKKHLSTFPIHPAIMQVLNKYMRANKLPREVTTRLALMVISDLDARGTRMYCADEDQLYFFLDRDTKLLKVDLNVSRSVPSDFSNLLYEIYNISALADTNLTNWISTMFAGESPILQVNPKRVMSRSDDSIYWQLSDSHFAEISASEFIIHQNGDLNLLFESKQTAPCDLKKLQYEYNKQSTKPLKCHWLEVLRDVRMQDKGKMAVLQALLYYISPWFYKWRNTQLPVELIIGEAGSGKSTLCELRSSILTGTVKLRNTPEDIRAWQSSVGNAGGLHITDNIQMADKQLRQKLSDELCRLVTDPNPEIEIRKLYSNAQTYTIPVNCVFAFTGIVNPFTANDLAQRSVVLELDKSIALDANNQIRYDGSWKKSQFEKFGGREGWLAHHFIVIQRFLQLCESEWDFSYKATHRLINFEQILLIMAKVFGFDVSWLAGYLNDKTLKTTVANDWVIDGLCLIVNDIREFKQRSANKDFENCAAHIRNLPTILNAKPTLLEEGYFTAANIVEWASAHDDFSTNTILTNARALGRYIINNHVTLQQICKIRISTRTMMNKKLYEVFA